MTTTQKTILAVLSVIAFTLLLAVGYFSVQAYQGWAQQPLGPALNASTPWSLPATWTPAPLSVAYSSTLAPTLSFTTSTPAKAPLCGGPNSMNILAIGSDTRGESYNYGLADVIRVVRVDFVTPRISILEFPRDLWVEIPEIADNINGQDHEKLNQAYLYGNPGDGFKYWDDPSAGPGLLARTLNINFGVQLDHYIAVNMHTFVKVVDAIDGIDVNLPDTVDGRTSDDKSKRLLFLEGKHHLNGTESLTLARIRIDGVFSRADNQNIVLCGLRKKLASPDVVTKIPDIIASFQDNIQTDLSPEQISQFACLGTKLKPENISFTSFPVELFKESRIYDPVFKKRVFVWDVNFQYSAHLRRKFSIGYLAWPIKAIRIKRRAVYLRMSIYDSIPPLNANAVLKRYGLRAEKSLGQNFLQDPFALEMIANAAEIEPDDSVLEIGPGLGSLTRYLAVSAQQVTAVELDADLLPPLKAILKPHANVRLIHGDILKLSPSKLIDRPNYIVVANIPYYITSAIIRHLLENQLKPRRMVLTIQKEVAERICAAPGDLSLLALSVQVYGKPSIVGRIPAEALYPAPKVDSAILRLDIYESSLIPHEQLETFFKLIKAGFGQKRKTLRNSLSSGLHISTSEAETLLKQADIDSQRRAETLSISEWHILCGLYK